MKRLEIVLERDQIDDGLRRRSATHATGYTVIPDVTGYGHHGARSHGDIVPSS